MVKYGCGTGASSVPVRMEFRRQHEEWLCQMLHGDFLLENFWSLASQIMRPPIVLQLVVILYRKIVFVTMGILTMRLSLIFTLISSSYC